MYFFLHECLSINALSPGIFYSLVFGKAETRSLAAPIGIRVISSFPLSERPFQEVRYTSRIDR